MTKIIPNIYLTLFYSLGISEEEIGGQIPKSDRQFRLEAIHIRGFDGSIVQSEDIHAYFSEFSPVSFEWVDKNSANVIWALPSSAAKALLTLSRPLKQDCTRDDKDVAKVIEPAAEEDDEMVDIRKADENSEQEDATETEVVEESTRIKKQKMKDKIFETFSQSYDMAVDVSQVGIDVPAGANVGQWRIGKPNDKLGVTIFMRIATRHDTALDDGTETNVGVRSTLSHEEIRQNNIKLKSSGGLISNSRKRKLQEVLLAEKAAAEEHEATKKYNGPVGKNPWGNIAQDWTSYGRKGERDFADELSELANLVGGKKKSSSGKFVANVESVDNPPLLLKREIVKAGPSIKYPVITTRPLTKFTDWDAPDQEETTVITSFRLEKDLTNARKRQRTEGDLDHTDEDNSTDREQDLKWSKRLKRPRMHMVADEIESKLSAKTRLYKGIQRRIHRPDVNTRGAEDRIEIYEEEEENEGYVNVESARHRNDPVISNKKETLTMSVRVDNRERRKGFSGVRMSERFPPRKGISASLRDRLGDFGHKQQSKDSWEENEPCHEKSFEVARHRNRLKTTNRQFTAPNDYESGDSLEMDQGDDLRGELDGQHAANMVIQVTQSPKRKENDTTIEEEELQEESDEEMDEDDRRQESHIASVVAKIKKEKTNDERIKVKDEQRDRDHRYRDNIGAQEERRHRQHLRRDRERERDEKHERTKGNREREIQERERLRKERHKQIEERKFQHLRNRDEKEISLSDHRSKRYVGENVRRTEHSRDISNDRPIRVRQDPPVRIKKEKVSDDERKKRRKGSPRNSTSSEYGSSASSSSSSSDESSTSSSSSDSESDSETSSSSSESSSEGDAKVGRNEGPENKKQKIATKPTGKVKATKKRPANSKPSNKKESRGKKNTSMTPNVGVKTKKPVVKDTVIESKPEEKGKRSTEGKSERDNTVLRDKLKDYLKKAKEKRKKEKNDTKE